MKTYTTSIIAVAMLAIFLSGCGGSKPSKFYALTPVKGVTGDFKTSLPATPFAIGIRTLKFPEYLLRQQIVRRTSSSEITMAEFDRWAEPLDANFQRVLIENLSRDVPTNNIFLFPTKDSSLTNYQLLVEVTEFESTGSSVTLSARWGIAKGEEILFLMDKKSSFSENVSNENYDAIVAAMSRLMGKLSEEIAREIRLRVGSGK